MHTKEKYHAEFWVLNQIEPHFYLNDQFYENHAGNFCLNFILLLIMNGLSLVFLCFNEGFRIYSKSTNA